MDGRPGLKGQARTPDTAFWVDRADVDEGAGRLRLNDSESRHLLRVFRAGSGTPFEAVDGEGRLYRCVLESAAEGIATGRIESRAENAGELAASIALVVGLPDLAQAETVVALAVPLGATRIDFVAAARSERGPLPAARLERLHRIARAALKQSRRTRLPAILSAEGLEAALRGFPASAIRLVADPAGAALGGLPATTAVAGPQPVIIMAIGPPGGFLGAEAALLRERGFAPISLGPSRLTTSTATIALLVAARNLLLTMGLGQVDKTGLSGYLQ